MFVKKDNKIKLNVKDFWATIWRLVSSPEFREGPSQKRRAVTLPPPFLDTMPGDQIGVRRSSIS